MTSNHGVNLRDAFVYRAYDRHGVLLYVGATSRPARRWAEHRARAPWFGKVRRWRVSGPLQRDTALHVEADAIKFEHPRHNKIRPNAPAHTDYHARFWARVDEIAGGQGFRTEAEYIEVLNAAVRTVSAELDPIRDGTCHAYQLSRRAS